MKIYGYRKLLAFVASSATVVLVQIGLAPEVADKITEALVWIAGFYLGSQGAVDVVAKAAKTPPPAGG